LTVRPTQTNNKMSLLHKLFSESKKDLVFRVLQLTAELNSAKLKVTELKAEIKCPVPGKNELAEAAEEADSGAIEDAAVQEAAKPVEAAGENPTQEAAVIDAAERAAAEHEDLKAFVQWVDARMQEEYMDRSANVKVDNFWHHEICPCWKCGGDYGILHDA